MNAVSIRFRDARVHQRLRAAANREGLSVSAYAERLIDEGLRRRDHPLIVFRDGPTGRRAALVSGPDVWQIVDGLIGGDVPESERVPRAAELLNLPVSHVLAALRYYADHTDEIDQRIAANDEATASG